MNPTSYKFQTADKETYSTLLGYIASFPCNLSLFPQHLTIVASQFEAERPSDENPDPEMPEPISETIAPVISYIETKGFDVTHAPVPYETGFELEYDPVADIPALRNEIKKLLSEHSKFCVEMGKTLKDFEFYKAESEKYHQWWLEGNTHRDRIKSQVKAIATMLSAIYPD